MLSAISKLALFAARIHAADAGDDAAVGMLVKPGQLTLDLQGELARRRDDQGQWCGGSARTARRRRAGSVAMARP